ncbi:MAG: Xaa-Pro dipeptidase [Saccharospirillum sp.]
MDLDLYQSHLNTLIQRYTQALVNAGYDQIVISAGSQVVVAEDDRTYPYTPMAFAQQWLPYDLHPDTFIVFKPGEKPRLLWPARADFWHLTPAAPQGDWTAHWQVDAATSLNDWFSGLSGKVAWLGPVHPQLDAQVVDINPGGLKAELVYGRACKTGFEIACLQAANNKAVLGHRAAELAFLDGQSEAEIYRDYLQYSQQLESQEPYSGIIALNESAATLHYERRQFERPDEHRTLLIDAGARVNGYASDITRTHTRGNALFAELAKGVERLALSLTDQVKPGVAWAEIHRNALIGIARLLHQSGLCRHDVDAQLAKKIPQTFFPHGVGHLLGLQVHDVGGHQQTVQGDRAPHPDYPFLRLTRDLQPGMVVTVEPGLYFIPMLLEKMVTEVPDHGCDLGLIETLKPYGGIRYEDNVVIAQGQALNLTRAAFQAIN